MGGGSAERWMVSYADFITLLFAFFVVMYAISSVNHTKYRELASTMRKNFGQGDGSALVLDDAAPGDLSEDGAPDPLAVIADRLAGALGRLLDLDVVDLRRTPRGVELEINSRMLFETAQSDLNEAYRPLMQRLADILAEPGYMLNVEGFTDDVPITNARFPSNWELSSARASAVVRLLGELGVDPGTMAAVGYGPHRPVADNSSELGRARNRRVVLVVRLATEAEADAMTGNAPMLQAERVTTPDAGYDVAANTEAGS
jgi:chemotaxis protein MotB